MKCRHGGKEASAFIRNNLHSLVESVIPSEASEVVDWTVDTHAGYFKRWKGGALSRWCKFADTKPEEGDGLTMEERLTLAFLKVLHTCCLACSEADEEV
jgi:protein phosphatase PTC6